MDALTKTDDRQNDRYLSVIMKIPVGKKTGLITISPTDEGIIQNLRRYVLDRAKKKGKTMVLSKRASDDNSHDRHRF